ncbi:PD-(D/E)XK motif protein [Emcibacteraceae bacterium]|nr:PD-(D/E)XK motif protein [Emcibacteraceae bacterium]
MISTHQKVIKTFTDIEKEGGPRSGRIRKRIDNSSIVKVFAARSFPEKQLMLEIGPIKGGWLPINFQKPRINGLDIQLVHKDNKPDSEVTLILKLQHKDTFDIFLLFATRVCDDMDNLSNPMLAAKSIVALIDRWKHFFSGNSGLLSPEKQTGLYGELFALRYILREGIGVEKGVTAWTGSKKTSQDFQFDMVAMEIKSSCAVNFASVKIANSDQLDNAALDHLFLVCLSFDKRLGDSKSLPILIEELKEIININSPQLIPLFEENLLAVGYQDKDSSYYINNTYSMLDIQFYKVVDGFPRITTKKKPPGVIKVSYDILLDALVDFKINKEFMIKTIGVSND